MSAEVETAAAAASPPLLETRGLGKSYSANRVLDDVAISIAPGEVVGLIGANGAGKSTLIKCVTGAVSASDGTFIVDGQPVTINTPDDGLRHGLAAVQQEVNLVTNHSVAENVMLGRFPSSFGFVSAGKLKTRVRELLRRVQLEHVDPETLAGELTPSEQRLVMVAAVLARDPRLLILDEPTAALPPEESAVVAKLVRELSADGVAVIYVTHRLHEVKDLCSRVIALRNGRQSGTLSNADVTRHNMLGLIGGTQEPETLLVSEEHAHKEVRETGEVVLELRNVSGKRVQDVSFDAHRGEVVGIAGLAGSGRSELLRLIYGLQPLSGGALSYKGQELGTGLRTRVRHRMGYVAELRGANVLRGLSVTRNLTCNSIGSHRRLGVFADEGWERATTQHVGGQVSLVGEPAAPIETLSGGNQQKVLIGRWLVRETELLLLDEPTAGVDLVARAEIHELLHELTEVGKTVIVASVEADELTTICDRVLVMVEGEIRAELTPPFTEEELVNALFSHRTDADPVTS
jgi:ABC-type sugar transport system ATPase subunit